MSLNQRTFYKAILVILGGFFVYVGINVGFGGIQTLGWQIPSDFVSIVNDADYHAQDSHVRFLGAFFGTSGLFMIIATSNLKRFETALRVIFVMTFVGGLARFTAMQVDVILDSRVITSFLGEVLLMPILFFWLSRVLPQEE